MCGIAGIIANRDADRQALGAAVAKMVDALVHRGPDDQGAEAITEDGRIWLANTRLAILDPSQAGHQPMQDPRTGNWIVLNGEIYNHLEIRSQLDHPWRSGSDTETDAWSTCAACSPSPSLMPNSTDSGAREIDSASNRSTTTATRTPSCLPQRCERCWHRIWSQLESTAGVSEVIYATARSPNH